MSRTPRCSDAAATTLSAIVCIDREAVGLWAELRGISYISYADLSQKPEVIELIAAAVKHVNRALPDGLAAARLRLPAQGIRRRRRRDHPNPQDPAQRRRGPLPADHRRHLRQPANRADAGPGSATNPAKSASSSGRCRCRRPDAWTRCCCCELAVNGALVGLMYSLVAMGIVLIYKSSSVPNLAQGAMTMLGAYVVLAFANNAGAPIWLAIPLGDRDHVRHRHGDRAGGAAAACRPAHRHDPDDDARPGDFPARAAR